MSGLLFELSLSVLLVPFVILPTIIVLKRKYVLLAVGLALLTTAVLLGEQNENVSSPLAGLALVVWVTASIRLAPPDSRWARQMYDSYTLARARQRPAGAAARIAERTDTRRHPATPETSATIPNRPGSITVATVLTAAGVAVLGLCAPLGVVGYAALPVLWLTRAGWRNGRLIATGIGVLTAGWAIVFLMPDFASIGTTLSLAVGLLLFAAGAAQLYRDPTTSYLRTATR